MFFRFSNLCLMILALNSAFCQNFNKSNFVTRKVLLENYGGARNGNCPAANDTATYIKNFYSNEVSVINVHAGFFAIPNATYPTDFRTQVGNDWDDFFGISIAGNPNGMINRKDFATNHIKSYSSWQTEVAGFIGQQAIAEISITYTYNTGSRLLDAGVKTKFLGTSNANYKLICVLTENGIIDKQLDYRLPSGSQINVAYVHNHVLRESFFGSWGSLLNTMPVVLNDSVIRVISNYNISSNYNDNNLNIVAFIYDTLSFEVMQVEQIGIQSTVTNIKSNSKEYNIILSPNPTNSNLSIRSSGDYNGVKIVNLFGQTVSSFEDKTSIVSVSDLSNGIYFIHLFDKKGNLLKSEKFIKE